MRWRPTPASPPSASCRSDLLFHLEPQVPKDRTISASCLFTVAQPLELPFWDRGDGAFLRIGQLQVAAISNAGLAEIDSTDQADLMREARFEDASELLVTADFNIKSYWNEPEATSVDLTPLIERWLNVPIHVAELEALEGRIDPDVIRRETPENIDRLHRLSERVFGAFIELLGQRKRHRVLSSR